MSVQRKVTSFVTRGDGLGRELLVFWHAGSGVQVPAGTVEPGEPFEAAAIREAAEETGLDGLELVRSLGVQSIDFPEGRAALVRKEYLRTAPAGPETSWPLTNSVVDVVAQADGFTRIVYAERDIDVEDGLEYARFEGWVPSSALASKQERAFYHFRTTKPSPEEWKQLENGIFEFHLRWEPLHPKPTVLVAGQQDWLDTYHSALTS
ncbi:NUDIX domain-containing protein [Tenggerimyces flavus]|uniref:NUDIX domain-containing protein n=1 Tax=Tenggerimyces flavus TaxID=1708749 RepID=A0ABV7Y991_9ACTN|nr:NUDIX domain-containing protein [Tenggerimyces flavus]MBM7785156.1 ADP-ribose pyrophosphatase YjhB (NUDIX family) [Tenggerimyces flavus]